METIQIFALIVLVLSSVKLITVLIKPKAWMNLVDRLWKHPKMTMVISFVLAAFVFYKLMQFITLTTFFAVVLLISLLYVFTFAIFAKEFSTMAHSVIKKGILKKAWLSILIWTILVVLGFIELFN